MVLDLSAFNWEIAVAIISAIVGALVVIITFYYQRRNLQFTAIIRIFQILSDKEHRNARKYVYDVWENSYFPKYNEEAFNESGYQVIAETAAIGFDEIAVLIYKKLDFKKLEPTSMVRGYLPKDEFFAAYSGAVINSWIALKTFIMKRRHNNV